MPAEPAQKKRFNLIFLLVAIIGILVVNNLFTRYFAAQPLAFSEFVDAVQKGDIKEVVVSKDKVRGEFKKPRNGRRFFVTTRVSKEMRELLDKHGIKYEGEVESGVMQFLVAWLLPIVFFFGLWFFLMRRMASKGGGDFLAIGKSKAKIYVESDTKTTFKDVAGVDEAIQELRETVEFLKNPDAHGRLGARNPKGVLLVGPPGTGKTLLARAVAGEAGVPFLSISGSEFVEMFVGVGAARVRDLFEQARSKAPCIIFIDELDALGRARNAFPGGVANDEKEQTLNQLLVELDGFDPTTGIVLLAATNRPEILDPALLRAGRFDRQILVGRPDKRGREAILRVHLKRIVLGDNVDPEKIAALTPGFTGADLANLVNEAALLATRRGAKKVGMEDFTAAVERVVAGLEHRTRILSEKERRIVAHHEMGHALTAAALGADPVHKVSIIPRGIGALGYTLQRPTEDRYLMTRQELDDKMCVLLGGRAAEKIVFDHLSTGASDDLAKVTDIARDMVKRYAMAGELGNVVFDLDPPGLLNGPSPMPRPREYSEATAGRIDEAVQHIVDTAWERTLVTLKLNKDLLLEAAAKLLEQETLSEDELKPFFQRVRRSDTP